jgi:hypothetical protein
LQSLSTVLTACENDCPHGSGVVSLLLIPFPGDTVCFSFFEHENNFQARRAPVASPVPHRRPGSVCAVAIFFYERDCQSARGAAVA